MPKKEFVAFTRLDASDVNTFLMDQSVMSFAGTAARGSAITTPVEGMTTYLEDSDRYESYSGAVWRPIISTGGWVSYTPTVTAINIGNGTIVAKYAIVGKTMHISIDFTLGSTSSVVAQPRVSLPSGFTIASSLFLPVGLGNVAGGGGNFPASIFPYNTTQLYPLVFIANQTYALLADVSATVPITFGTGSVLSLRATLEIA
jgi:hypothetical protein